MFTVFQIIVLIESGKAIIFISNARVEGKGVTNVTHYKIKYYQVIKIISDIIND